MVLPEANEYAYVIGIVGEAGSGKSTLAKALVRHLSAQGLDIVERNAGDASRGEAERQGMTVEQYTAIHKGNRRELDKVVDAYTLAQLKMAIGISEWHERYGERSPVVLVMAGRMLSWLAEIPLNSGELPADGLFRVVVECNDQVKGERGAAEAVKKGEEITEEEALGRYKKRDADDEASFRSLYGIGNMDSLWSEEIHDLVLKSDELTLEQEVEQTICELRARGLLYGECVTDPVSNVA